MKVVEKKMVQCFKFKFTKGARIVLKVTHLV